MYTTSSPLPAGHDYIHSGVKMEYRGCSYTDNPIPDASQCAPSPTISDGDGDLSVQCAPSPTTSDGDGDLPATPSHRHTLGDLSVQCAPSPTTSDGDGDLPATPSHRHTLGDLSVQCAPSPTTSDGDGDLPATPSHRHTLGDLSVQCAPSPTTSDGDGDLPAMPSHRHTTPKQAAQSRATEDQGHHVPHFLKHIAYKLIPQLKLNDIYSSLAHTSRQPHVTTKQLQRAIGKIGHLAK